MRRDFWCEYWKITALDKNTTLDLYYNCKLLYFLHSADYLHCIHSELSFQLVTTQLTVFINKTTDKSNEHLKLRPSCVCRPDTAPSPTPPRSSQVLPASTLTALAAQHSHHYINVTEM